MVRVAHDRVLEGNGPELAIRQGVTPGQGRGRGTMMNGSSTLSLLLLVALVALAGGCATAPPPPPVAAARFAPPPAEAAVVPERDDELPEGMGPFAERPLAAPVPEPEPAVAGPAVPVAPISGEAAIMVVTHPAGATVVMDGRPIGQSPLTLNVPVTNRGFLSRQVSVKVRFLAGETAERSHTTELVLTPLDRVPVRLDFTPQGAKRTLASLH